MTVIHGWAVCCWTALLSVGQRSMSNCSCGSRWRVARFNCCAFPGIQVFLGFYAGTEGSHRPLFGRSQPWVATFV